MLPGEKLAASSGNARFLMFRVIFDYTVPKAASSIAGARQRDSALCSIAGVSTQIHQPFSANIAGTMSIC
jgi:hypothetical protein